MSPASCGLCVTGCSLSQGAFEGGGGGGAGRISLRASSAWLAEGVHLWSLARSRKSGGRCRKNGGKSRKRGARCRKSGSYSSSTTPVSSLTSIHSPGVLSFAPAPPFPSSATCSPASSHAVYEGYKCVYLAPKTRVRRTLYPDVRLVLGQFHRCWSSPHAMHPAALEEELQAQRLERQADEAAHSDDRGAQQLELEAEMRGKDTEILNLRTRIDYLSAQLLAQVSPLSPRLPRSVLQAARV